MLAAQAQKEITHNEALVVIDALLSGCVEGVASDPDSVVAQEGQAWIVGPSPLGIWAGHAAKIAIFTAGGWRFAPPVTGMRLYERTGAVVRLYDGSVWLGPGAIIAPAGGDIIDVEARSTLASLLSALRNLGLVEAT
jgi:hypothetical protein